MQGSEKQRDDVTALLGMAQQRGLLQDDPSPKPDGPPEALGDDETDPEAEAALSGAQDAGAPPGGSQEPGEARVGVLEWFVMPKGFEVEPGTHVAFLRIPASQTAKPRLGDRQCMLVPLSVKRERLAYKRAAGLGDTGMISAYELAKATIVVIDGQLPEWVKKGTPTSPDQFWEDIGPKFRQFIVAWYSKTHVMGKEERAGFLASCLDDRIMG
jgi:hypothetical protein